MPQTAPGSAPTTDFLAANYAPLARRWPQVAAAVEEAIGNLPGFAWLQRPCPTLVIDGIQLTSAHDRTREATLQAARIPAGSRQAWVYGMALGDVPRLLLQRPELRNLQVVLFNPGVAALSLYFFDHRDWLDDPRVSLVVAGPEDTLQQPYAALPACLHLADDAASRLRDLICLDLATPFIRKRHQPDNPHLRQRLTDNAAYVAQDPSIEALCGTFPGRTAVVAGAGPTLSDHYGWLRDSKPGPLIAVDAAVRPLLAAGIIPDVVVGIDGHADIYDLFFRDLDLTLLRRSALVYFPVVQPELLKYWPGQRHAAYSDAPIYSELAARHPKERLFSSGSVIHPATDLATRLGVERVLFAGADFSFPGGQSHVAGCSQARPAQGSHWVLNGHGERVPTLPNLRAYLRDLEEFIAGKTGIQFRNAGSRGAAIRHAQLLEEPPWTEI